MSQPIYALNLFNVSNKNDYLACSRRSAGEVKAHGRRVVAARLRPVLGAGETANILSTMRSYTQRMLGICKLNTTGDWK